MKWALKNEFHVAAARELQFVFSRQETRGYFIQVEGDHAVGLMAHKAPLERAWFREASGVRRKE